MKNEITPPKDNKTVFITGLTIMLIGYLFAILVSELIVGYDALLSFYVGCFLYAIGSVIILISKRKWWTFLIIAAPVFITLAIVSIF